MKASEHKVPLFPTSVPSPLTQPIAAFSREGWTLTLALLALLLVTRPFVGIFHDAHYYAVQALQRLDGNTLHEDLIFLFGNQDAFSPFTRMYAPLVDWLGLGRAYQLLWASGMLLWATSLIFAARQIFGGIRLAYVAAGLALAMSSNYGVVMLQYGENFVTPRLFAESFALFAIGFYLRGRFALAILFFAACLICHPLVGLGLAIFAAWFVLQDWRSFSVLALGGVVALMALGLTEIEPFAWIFQVIDAEWQAMLDDIGSIIFLSNWQLGKVIVLTLLHFTVLFVIWRAGPPEAAKFAKSLLILSVLALLGSAIAADLLRNRFLAGLQIWRVMLFVALFANMMVVILPALPKRHSRTKGLLLLAVGFNIAETNFEMLPIGAATIAAAALTSFSLERWSGTGHVSLLPRVVATAIAVSGIVVSLFILAFLLMNRLPMTWHAEAMAQLAIIIATGWVLTKRGGRITKYVASACLLAGLLVLDDRSPRQKFVLSEQPIPEVARSLMQGKTVYWETSLDLQWFKLRVPAFFNCYHQAGSAFYREQAIEYMRRHKALQVLETGDLAEGNRGACPIIPGWGQKIGDQEALRSICSSLPELELIVLRREVGNTAVFSFDIPAPAESRPFTLRGQEQLTEPTHYHVHDCRRYRSKN